MARCLYIVSRGTPGRSEQVFALVKQDMATSTVALTLDRRRQERRRETADVPVERRRGDRRRHSVDEEIARVGWARVEIE
jgi:hypothetical protein